MATENPGRILSANAANAIIESVFVKRTTGGGITTCNVKGERADGVNRHGIDAGNGASIQVPPCIVFVKAGGPLDDGEYVITSVAGKALSSADEGVAGMFILGKVCEGSSATAEDDIVSIDMYAVPQQIHA